MNSVGTIAKNAGVLLVSYATGQILNFFYLMYTARFLGAEGFGILSFALSFAGIFGMIINLGLRWVLVREVARNKISAKKYLGNIITIRLILAILAFGSIILIINLLGYPKEIRYIVYLIALSIIFRSLSNTFYSLFQAYEKMEYQSIGNVLYNVLLLSGALLAISHGLNIVFFAFLYLFASLIVLIYAFIICIWKFVLPKIEIDISFWKSLIKEALPFGLSGIFATTYHQIGIIILSLAQGNEAVGWYNAAYKLITILLLIQSVFNISVFPAMARFSVMSKYSLRFAFEKYFKYMTMIIIPISISITLLAEHIILLIFGAEYKNSAMPLQILAWAVAFIFTSSAFKRLFESLNKQIIVTKITGICTMLNVISNIILIPKYSYIGVGISMLITELFVLILCYIWSLKIGYPLSKKRLLDLCRELVAGTLMGAFIIYFININLLILLAFSALIYLIALYFLKGIEKEDIYLFKKIIKSAKHQ